MNPVYLDLTVIDRMDDETIAAVTHDNFVALVAAETQRVEAETDRMYGDHTRSRRPWEENWS